MRNLGFICPTQDTQRVHLKVYWQHFMHIPEPAVIRSLICLNASQLSLFRLQSCQGISSSYFVAHFYNVDKTGHCFPSQNLQFQMEDRSFQYI